MAEQSAFDKFISFFTDDIKDAFLLAMQDIVNRAILIDIQKAILEGDVIGAFRAMGFNAAAMRPITAAIERAFEQGGVLTGEEFPKYLNTPSGRTVFRFDVRNSRAEAWLRDHSSSLVTRLTDEARTNVKNTLFENMQAGNNPRRTALDLVGRVDPSTGNRVGGVIGLTTQQERWVVNARKDLENLDENYFTRKLRDKRSDSVVRKAIADGKPLTRETIDKLVIKYRSNALRYRGEMIGRTEAIQSLNRSEYEAVKQAVDLGAVNQSATRREWDSAGDSRVRWSHRKLNKQTVGLDEPFVSPSGARMMHPGDTSLGAPGAEVIACRCRVKLKVDWLADLD